MPKLLIPIVTVLLAAPFAWMVTAAPSSASIPFTTISNGNFSNWQGGQADFVVRRQNEWELVWNQHFPGTGPPKIDFKQYDVYCCFMGYITTGGYSIEVTGIENDGAKVTVNVVETSPGINCAVTNVITNPHHFVAVPKQPSIPVRFNHQYIVNNCP
ncbi:MAG: protease complex subunit PrcB family protein [Planctomycetota bacterium]